VVRCGGADNSVEVDDDGEVYESWSWSMLLLLLFPALTVFGNVLVCLSVYRERSLQTATNFFIVSLAIAPACQSSHLSLTCLDNKGELITGHCRHHGRRAGDAARRLRRSTSSLSYSAEKPRDARSVGVRNVVRPTP